MDANYYELSIWCEEALLASPLSIRWSKKESKGESSRSRDVQKVSLPSSQIWSLNISKLWTVSAQDRINDSLSLADPTKLCHHACARCMHSSSQCHKCWYFLNNIFRMQSHWIHSWKHAKWLKSFIKVHLCDFSATTSHLQPLSFISCVCACVFLSGRLGTLFISVQFFSYLKHHLTSCLFWGQVRSFKYTEIYAAARTLSLDIEMFAFRSPKANSHATLLPS